MISQIKKTTVAIILGSCSWNAFAVINTTVPAYWPEGNGGGLASDCIFTVSNQQPLSIPRTIVADNNMPNGTILYSWDYGDFGSISFNCPLATPLITNAANTVPIVRLAIQPYYYGVSTNMPEYGAVIDTNNSGVRVKLYFKVIAKAEYDSGYGNVKTTIFNADGGLPMQVGVEYTLNENNYHVMHTVMSSNVVGSSGNYKHTFDGVKNNYTYSIRGEVIKVGNIETSTNLAFRNNGYLRHSGTTAIANILYTDLFGSNGITFIKPSCRLRGVTGYTVNLGRWVDRLGGSNSGELPATGPEQQTDINLECNGAANVNFNFQDTGSTASSNSNIGVYDSIGGQLIEGLEIEMLYGGSRINVRKPSENVTDGKINVGTHGSYSGTPANPNNFNSQSQAQFGARFIQRSAIKRNGVPYTGPVTGKVNMFVIYQ